MKRCWKNREQFDKYQVDLDSSSRVHIFLINMDTWGEFNTYSDKNTARFAVKNIIEEFLAPLAKVFVTDVDEQKMIDSYSLRTRRQWRKH